jgi:hypothetical protein
LELTSVAIRGRAQIDEYLGQLRYLDDRYLAGSARRIVDQILDAHSITVEPGREDYWQGSGIPLRNALSLLDAEHRRCRVSEIRVQTSPR